jgi:hypothetical protein
LGEDKSKGSIEAGKRADLVILDKNPLKVDKDAIKDIKVLMTIKDGTKVFEYDPATAMKPQIMGADLASDPCELNHKGRKVPMVAMK